VRLEFEWDSQKARNNEQKHRVSFEEAATVFGDPLSITIPDPLHSCNEQRFIIIVQSSSRRRILVVAHAGRGNRIRIVSARLATQNERRKYEEN
jgi:uncharacterized protein